MTKEDIKQIRQRIMCEAYDLADRGDHEGYNAVKVMCSEVLELINAAVAAEHNNNELSLLKDQRVLIEKIIEGCGNVREDKGLHKDAHDLARLVIQDCRGLLMFIKE